MKRTYLYTLVGGFLLSLGIAQTVSAKSDIPSPQARAQTLNSAEKLLQPPSHQYDPSAMTLINPFVPKQAVHEVLIDKNARPASDQDFLTLLAAKLNPTGVLMLGDDALLLFGEKKVKVGETIMIPFDKDSIAVELIDLTRTSFTLRLNHEQLTRPIKPAKSQ